MVNRAAAPAAEPYGAARSLVLNQSGFDAAFDEITCWPGYAASALVRLDGLARTLGVQTVATGDAHAHHPRRAPLQDVLVAVRHCTSLDGCEAERRGNHESVLLTPADAAARSCCSRRPRCVRSPVATIRDGASRATSSPRVRSAAASSPRSRL